MYCKINHIKSQFKINHIIYSSVLYLHVVVYFKLSFQHLGVRTWKLEVRTWKLEVRTWKLGVRTWKLEVRTWKPTRTKIYHFSIVNALSNYGRELKIL